MGFQTVVQKGITLDVGRQPVIDLRLPVGRAEQTVNVESTVSQVETSTSAVSSLVNQTQMRELPFNMRHFEQLVLLAEGGLVSGGPVGYLIGRNATFSVAGRRTGGRPRLMDGENLQNWWQRGSGAGVTGTSLGIEAIAEFQTLTNTYGPAFAATARRSTRPLIRHQLGARLGVASSATVNWTLATSLKASWRLAHYGTCRSLPKKSIWRKRRRADQKRQAVLFLIL